MFYSELLTLVLGLVFLLLSAVFCFFLFARASRHELVDWNVLFDIGFFSVFGGLLFGRLFDFLTNPALYQWSLKKLIFFNVWVGISFWGMLIGIVVFTLLYLRNKKENLWFILDLAASPLALMRGLSGLFLVLSKEAKGFGVNLSLIMQGNIEVKFGLIYFFYYLILFWVIKRLEKRKRHRGFFICLFLVFASVFEFLITFAVGPREFLNMISYSSILPLGFLIFASVMWYILAKRKPVSDLKNVFAFLLLGLFNFRRVLFSANEAGKVSRAILFSPVYLIRSLYFGIRTLFSEVAYSFADLFHSFKPKK